MQPTEAGNLVAEIVALVQQLVYARDSNINAQTRFADLDLDSLDIVEAGLELEAIVGCDLPDGAFASMTTIGDLAGWATGRGTTPQLSLAS